MKGGSFDYRIDHKLHDFVIGDVRMDEGEVLAIYPCEDNSSYTKEEYLYFDETSVKSEEGKDLVLILKGAAKDEKEPAPKEGHQVRLNLRRRSAGRAGRHSGRLPAEPGNQGLCSADPNSRPRHNASRRQRRSFLQPRLQHEQLRPGTRPDSPYWATQPGDLHSPSCGGQHR